MTTQPSLDSPVPASVNPQPNAIRGLIGGLFGAVAGWLIDSAINATLHAGVRAGSTVGGFFGSVAGSKSGWAGAGLMLSMMVCSAAGVAACMALTSPDANDFVRSILPFVGGIIGASAGLVVGAVIIQSRRHRRSRQA